MASTSSTGSTAGTGWRSSRGTTTCSRTRPSSSRPARAANLPLLLDDQATFAVRGRPTPVQVLGVTWGEPKSHAELTPIGGDPDRTLRVYTEQATARAVRTVSRLRRPGAFPVLLAHHPHAVEPAAAAGLPLVLSGHSHGGQVMLTDHVGAGPLRFRYWNGVHRLGRTTLSICNGVGSWFPLRVNAPAEVVHVTLRHAPGEV
jgi:predicted MPP superfamily phosphohydrolase